MISAIVRMFSSDPNTPSLKAATRMSSSRCLAWPATQSASTARMPSTPRVSCTVSAVTTESGWHPMPASVKRSACSPAPPVGSDAAKVSTIGGEWDMIYYPTHSTASLSMTDKQVQFKTWMCLICGFVYDEAAGLPEEGIAAGTRWEDVPMNWTCPECGARKDDFEMVEI